MTLIYDLFKREKHIFLPFKNLFLKYLIWPQKKNNLCYLKLYFFLPSAVPQFLLPQMYSQVYFFFAYIASILHIYIYMYIYCNSFFFLYIYIYIYLFAFILLAILAGFWTHIMTWKVQSRFWHLRSAVGLEPRHRAARWFHPICKLQGCLWAEGGSAKEHVLNIMLGSLAH